MFAHIDDKLLIQLDTFERLDQKKQDSAHTKIDVSKIATLSSKTRSNRRLQKGKSEAGTLEISLEFKPLRTIHCPNPKVSITIGMASNLKELSSECNKFEFRFILATADGDLEIGTKYVLSKEIVGFQKIKGCELFASGETLIAKGQTEMSLGDTSFELTTEDWNIAMLRVIGLGHKTTTTGPEEFGRYDLPVAEILHSSTSQIEKTMNVGSVKLALSLAVN